MLFSIHVNHVSVSLLMELGPHKDRVGIEPTTFGSDPWEQVATRPTFAKT